MDDSFQAGLYVGGGSLVTVFLMRIFDFFKDKRQDDAQTNAVIADATGKTNLIEALEARVGASEARQNAQDGRIKELEDRVSMEIDLRLKGQVENHQLRLRIIDLEYAIKQLGGPIPAWEAIQVPTTTPAEVSN